MRTILLAPMLLAITTLAQTAPPPLPAQTPSTRPAESSVDSVDKPKRMPPVGLLTPIPEDGGLPPIYSKMYDLTVEEIQHRAKVRDYARQVRSIRHKHFGPIKVERIRKEGIALLNEFADSAAFQPMIEELGKEKDDVRLAMLDHFAAHGEGGQAALAWVAVHDADAAIRNESTRRMTTPVPESVKYILDSALRSRKHEVANSAAVLSGALHVIDVIPLLITALATRAEHEQDKGDLAWIAIQTQRAYVAALIPIVGDGSGAFQPVMGTVSDGVVLRVVDAVAISYRTEVHRTLVTMTTNDWGQPTDHMAYNMKAWWEWYNTKYVPFKKEQAEAARLAGES